MTQERYQEAAELCQSESDTYSRNVKEHDLFGLAAEVLTKLASGWVLVLDEPVAWRWKHASDPERGFWSYSALQPVPIGNWITEPLYAAAPKP